MDDLNLLLQSRLQRITELFLPFPAPCPDYPSLKSQQLSRCTHQNSLLLSLKLSPPSTPSSKLYSYPQPSSLYNNSSLVMKSLNTNFTHQSPSSSAIIENFLDKFVGLYKSFFKTYQNTLNFKVKIESYIRPTNVRDGIMQHHVVVDLVRYLVEFTRDYYQQVFAWRNRVVGAGNGGGNCVEGEEKKIVRSSSVKEGGNGVVTVAVQAKLSLNFGKEKVKQKGKQRYQTSQKERQSFTTSNRNNNPNLIASTATNRNASPECFDKDDPRNRSYDRDNLILKAYGKTKPKQKSINNHLDIIQTSIPTILPFFDVNSATAAPTSYLKHKINELFKEMKSRNSHIKSIVNGFEYLRNLVLVKQYPQKKQQAMRKDRVQRDKGGQGFNLDFMIIVEKNGNHWLDVQPSIAKSTSMKDIPSQRQRQKPEDQQLLTTNQLSRQSWRADSLTKPSRQPLSSQQKHQRSITLRHSMLTDCSKLTMNNLKILRLTDNFLPPLFLTKKNKGVGKNGDGGSKQGVVGESNNNGGNQNGSGEKSKSRSRKFEDVAGQTEEKLLKWLNKVKVSKDDEKKRLFGLG